MGEEEEHNQPRRPRVVDKRVSARTAPVETPTEPAAPVPAPGEGGPAEPATAPEPATPVAQDPPEAGEAAPAPATVSGPEEAVWTPEREAEAQAIAEELSQVPALDWVANAAITLANVGAAKIQMGQAPDARLAIDALGALIDGLGDGLGEAEQPLRHTLAQLRFAYAQAMSPPPVQPGG